MVKESIFWNISFIVIALHLILFGWMAYSANRYPIQKKTQPMVVKTISLQPPEIIRFTKQEVALKKEPIKKELQKPKIEPQSQPKPKPKIEPKKESKPQPKAVVTPSPKIETKPDKPVNSKVQNLLAQAQATMEKVQKSPEKLSAISLPVPQITNTKENLSFKETSYQNELASLFKLLLRLPEYGQVVIELTLDRAGKIKKSRVLDSESELNQGYIEKAIQTLSFPPFGNNFPGAAEHTFRIQLDNES